MKKYTIILIIIFIIVPLSFIASLRPQDNDDEFAIFFSPYDKKEECFLDVIKAGGRPIRFGAYECLIIAKAKDGNKFRENIEEQTSALVLNPIIMGGCFNESRNNFVKLKK